MWQKYAKIHDLIPAFVWHLDGSDPPETYALTHGEALTVAGTMGWLTTASWTGSGAYNTNNPGARLVGEEPPERIDDEQQPLLGDSGLLDQQALPLGFFAVRAQPFLGNQQT